ncbi:MAG: hypothetical protein HOO88_01190 [Kiritimatiellaceae bacterium]|nr:hypothetical protein [Kiritimatiellaceae bacterium]
MKTTAMILAASAVLLAAGCKTTEPKPPEPVKWKEQSAYMAKVRDPRIYGFNIYQTPGGGIEYRDGCRLHPNQIAELPMKAKEPLRPVVMLRGNFGLDSPVLFDFTAAAGWLEFDLAQELGAIPLNERTAQLVKMPGEEFAGCLSTVPVMRFKQLHVERPLVYVRMANGPIGTLARGIEEPELKGVLGWDLLKNFGQIHLDYAGKRTVISTVEAAYVPEPSLLIARVPLVKHAGVCAVRGLVDGKPEIILIDPAGDFEVATAGAQAVSSVQLDPGLGFSSPAASSSPGGLRIGAQLLKNFKITVCPKEGAIYFEKPETAKDS